MKARICAFYRAKGLYCPGRLRSAISSFTVGRRAIRTGRASLPQLYLHRAKSMSRHSKPTLKLRLGKLIYQW